MYRFKTLWQTPGYPTIDDLDWDETNPIEVEFRQGEAGTLQQIKLTRNTTFSYDGTDMPWGMVLDKKRGERSAPVRVTLDPAGMVSQIDRTPSVYFGMLDVVSSGSIRLTGKQGPPYYNIPLPGYGIVYDPKSFLDPMQYVTSSLSVPYGPTTQFTLNKDRITSRNARHHAGRFVTIQTDCFGKAKHVDILRFNKVFDFHPPERDPMEYRTVRRPKGESVKIPQAFLENDGTRWVKKVPISPNVRAYDTDLQSFRFSDARWLYGIACVWKDPGSGVITHIFWMDSGEGE